MSMTGFIQVTMVLCVVYAIGVAFIFLRERKLYKKFKDRYESQREHFDEEWSRGARLKRKNKGA